MKYLKTYENFTENDMSNDLERGFDAQYDHSNSPVIRQSAKQYVQSVLHSNQYKKVFNDLGKEVPKEIDGQDLEGMFDQIEDEAIKFYTKNPERMTVDVGDGNINKMAITGGNLGNDLTANTPVITHT